ncbi:MAG: diguanylate cyclase [Solobacterium sp.]|nr:diguanylate cyclase [Solobacterium sp.]
MAHELLVVYVFQHIFFFVYGVYMLLKFSPDIARNTEYVVFRSLIYVFLFYLTISGIWSFVEYDVIFMPRWLFWILCIFDMGSIVTAGVVLYRFVLLRLAPELSSKGWVSWFGPALYAIQMIALVTSYWTHFLISVAPGNEMVYEPAFLLFPLLSVVSFCVLIVIAIKKLLNETSASAKRSCLTIIVSLVLIIFCGVVDNVFEKTSILPIAIFGALYFIFINMQESSINSDQLTNMNNRRRADEFLSERMASISEQSPIYLFMLDINSFKAINDTYGHPEGDIALTILADAIKQAVGEVSAFAARYGGDEFLLAWRPQESAEEISPEQLIDNIASYTHNRCEQLNRPYDITISYGYMRCEDPSISYSTYMKQADEKLYETKRQFHMSHS